MRAMLAVFGDFWEELNFIFLCNLKEPWNSIWPHFFCIPRSFNILQTSSHQLRIVRMIRAMRALHWQSLMQMSNCNPSYSALLILSPVQQRSAVWDEYNEGFPTKMAVRRFWSSRKKHVGERNAPEWIQPYIGVDGVGWKCYNNSQQQWLNTCNAATGKVPRLKLTDGRRLPKFPPSPWGQTIIHHYGNFPFPTSNEFNLKQLIPRLHICWQLATSPAWQTAVPFDNLTVYWLDVRLSRVLYLFPCSSLYSWQGRALL